MGVIKLTEQESKYILMNTLDKKENLINELVDLVTSTGFKGIVPFEIRVVRGKKVILSNLTGMYSILTRLQSPIDSGELLIILKGLLDSMQEIMVKKIPPTQLDLDLDYIFIRRDGTVLFTLWPLNNLAPKVPIPMLLRQIGEEAKPNARKDQNFIEGYLQLFDESFSLERLDKFINSNYAMLKSSAMTGHGSGNIERSEASAQETREPERPAQPIMPKPIQPQSFDEEDDVLAPTGKTTFLADMDDDDEDDGKTSMLVTEDSITRFIVRLSTDERYDIDSNSVTIGKQGNDINITGNKAISRKHARIIIFDGTVTIEDLGSSNGTRLNSTKLTPGQPQEIVAGETFTIANESFMYYEE